MNNRRVRIHALVTEAESSAVRSAAKLLASAIADAGTTLEVECLSLERWPDLAIDRDAIVIISLLAETDSDEPWPLMAERLRLSFAKVKDLEDVPLFVCTVFRHVGRDVPREVMIARRIRIRQLNLFAAELSQATNLQVIDLDRMLSHIGAFTLQTDYRLGGTLAVAAVARCIALTLLTAGLDAHASYEVQEAARAAISAQSPPWQETVQPRPEPLRDKLMEFGPGRRKQRVSPVRDAVPENNIQWLVTSALKGRISPMDSYQRLRNGIFNYGVRRSLAMLLTVSIRIIRTRLSEKRIP